MLRILGKVVVIGLAIQLLLLPLTVGCAESEEEEAVEVVKIGWVGGLTGPASATYNTWLAANQAYINYINEMDPIPGVKLEFVLYDTRYDPSREVLAYHKMKDEGVLAILTSSGTFMAMAKPLLAEDHISVVAGGTVYDHLVPPGWIFGTNNPFEFQTEDIMLFIQEDWDYETAQRNPKLGFLGWNMPYGTANLAAIESFADEFDIDLLQPEIVPVGAVDVSINARRVADAGADWVFACLLPGPASSALKELHAIYPGEMEVMTMYSELGQLINAVGPEAAEGMYISNYTPDPQSTLPGVQFMRSVMDWNYPQGWGKYDNPSVLGMWHNAVFVVEALRAVVADKGVEGLNGLNLYEALETVEVDTGGVVREPMYYGTDNRVGGYGTYVYQVRDGVAVLLDGWWDAQDQWPE